MWLRFFKALRTGEYKVSPVTWVALAGTAIYTVWPLDLVPDMIPIAGLVDDLGLWGVLLAIATREKQRWEAQLRTGSINVTPRTGS